MSEAKDFQTFEIERLSRAILAQLAPLTGTRARGTAIVRRAEGYSGTVALPRNAYAIPVTSSQAKPEEYSNSLVKTAANPETAEPFDRCGQWEIGDDPVEVDFVVNVGGAPHVAHLKAGDRLRFEPPIEGLEPEAEIETDWEPGEDGLFKTAVIFDGIDVPQDLMRSNLNRLPGVAVSWVGSTPTEGLTAGMRQGASRKSRTVQLYYEQFVVTIFTAAGRDMRERRRVGLALMEAVSNALTGVKTNQDGEGISDVAGPGIEITTRQLALEGQQFNAYAVAFRAVSSLERVDVRQFAPWLRTKLEASLPPAGGQLSEMILVAPGPGTGTERTGIHIEMPNSEEPEVWLVDSSPFITSPNPADQNVTELWSYSPSVMAQANYGGPPSNLIRLYGPATGTTIRTPGRGHGLCLLQSGHILVSTSESGGGNYNEGWALVFPGATGKLRLASGEITPDECLFYKSGDIFAHITTPEVGTARQTLQFEDGTILIGGASHWAMCTLDDLLNGTMTGLPTWTLPGVHGTYANYDAAVIPGTKTVIFENNNGISIVDFDVPPGAINTANVKRAGGSNFGTGAPADLYGHLALGPDLRLYKQRVSSSDIPWWNMSTLMALTSTVTNPVPDGVLTSPSFSSLEAGVEHLFCCLDFDSLGRLYTASQRSSNYTNAKEQSATMWRFSAAAAADGGSQNPERTIKLPAQSQPWMLRCTSPLFAR